MSGFGTSQSVEIDQDFFDSGYSYNSQAQGSQDNAADANEQSWNYSQGYSQYDQPGYGSSTGTGSYANTGYYNPYDYGASGPTASSAASMDYGGFSGSMQARQTSEDYTTFGDEPPLLEGTMAVRRGTLCITLQNY